MDDSNPGDGHGQPPVRGSLKEIGQRVMDLGSDIEWCEYIDWLDGWFLMHSDAWHPGTRLECEDCQEMIETYGPMPDPKDLVQYSWDRGVFIAEREIRADALAVEQEQQS